MPLPDSDALTAPAEPLALKPGEDSGFRREVDCDHLDRDEALQNDLAGFVHYAHAAAAKFTQNLVSGRRRPLRSLLDELTVAFRLLPFPEMAGSRASVRLS